MQEHESSTIDINVPPQPIAKLPAAAASRPEIVAATGQFFRPVNTEDGLPNLPDDLTKSPAPPVAGTHVGVSNGAVTGGPTTAHLDTTGETAEPAVDLLAELLFPFEGVDSDLDTGGLGSLDWFEEVEADPATEMEPTPVVVPVTWMGSATAIPVAAPDS